MKDNEPPINDPPIIEDLHSDFPIYEKLYDDHSAFRNKKTRWPKILLAIVALLMVMILAISAVYSTMIEQHRMEKLIAAEGVADTAMALAYAQVFHLKPQKQNWSDPNFLKNNLLLVLSTEYPAFSNIDNLGQFKNCPYFLRVYTSANLSRFIVIAQPEPSLLQWLIPKEAVVVDSHTLEIRQIEDLKSLNRLLVQSNSLDGNSAAEISELVLHAERMPLSTLGHEKGFAPPKALALLRPGAEHLIYNAPRYRQFGETLLNKALHFYQIPNQHGMKRLQQQLGELTRFPHLVLYSTHGIQKATDALRALNRLIPQTKFLVAYLNLSPDGTVLSSHLLLDGHDNAMSSSSQEDLKQHLRDIGRLIGES